MRERERAKERERERVKESERERYRECAIGSESQRESERKKEQERERERDAPQMRQPRRKYWSQKGTRDTRSSQLPADMCRAHKVCMAAVEAIDSSM